MTEAPGSRVQLPRLLDERSRPDFRDVYGTLLLHSLYLDVALTRIRLSTLDLSPRELERLRRIRLLLAEVNAVSLDAEAHGVLLRSDRQETLRSLTHLLATGVIEVRAAPLAGWAPDFSVFRGPAGPLAVLLGFHWFERPFPHRGPALASLHGPDEAGFALQRFEDLWTRGHDVGAAVLAVLERARPPAKPLETEGFQGPRALSDRG